MLTGRLIRVSWPVAGFPATQRRITVVARAGLKWIRVLTVWKHSRQPAYPHSAVAALKEAPALSAPGILPLGVMNRKPFHVPRARLQTRGFNAETRGIGQTRGFLQEETKLTKGGGSLSGVFFVTFVACCE
jgi:hypothetical protein